MDDRDNITERIKRLQDRLTRLDRRRTARRGAGLAGILGLSGAALGVLPPTEGEQSFDELHVDGRFEIDTNGLYLQQTSPTTTTGDVWVDTTPPAESVLAIYSSDDQNAYVYDLTDGTNVYTFSEATDRVVGAAISNNYALYTSNDNTGYLHDLSDGSLVYTFDDPTNYANGAAIDEASGYAGVASADQNAYIYNLSDGSLQYTLTEANDTLADIEIGSGFIVYSSYQGAAFTHYTSDGSSQQPLTDPNNLANYVAITDQYTAVTGQNSCWVYTTDALDGSFSPTPEYELQQATDYLNGVGLSTDYITYGSIDNSAYVHDLADGSFVRSLDQATDDVTDVAMTPTYTIYGSFDNNAYVHGTSDGGLDATLTGASDNINGVDVQQ